MRAIALARIGDHGQAVAKAKAVVARAASNGKLLSLAAYVYAAAASAAAKDESLPEEERTGLAVRDAAQAVEHLVKARAARYFNSASAVEDMKKDPDLALLRDRDDYKKFLRSVTSGEPQP